MPSSEQFLEKLREHYSNYVLRKARKLLEEGKLYPKGPLGHYRAGGLGGNYVVQVVLNDETDETELPWVLCDCDNGANTAGGRPRCYHSAAALMDVQERQARLGE